MVMGVHLAGGELSPGGLAGLPAPQLTLVGAVVEDVEGLHGGWTSLLVPKNKVDPLVEVG